MKWSERREKLLDEARARIEHGREAHTRRKQRALARAERKTEAGNVAALMRQMALELEGEARVALADALSLREGAVILDRLRREAVSMRERVSINAAEAERRIEAEVERLGAE